VDLNKAKHLKQNFYCRRKYPPWRKVFAIPARGKPRKAPRFFKAASNKRKEDYFLQPAITLPILKKGCRVKTGTGIKIC
jgi:hypothetical protein